MLLKKVGDVLENILNIVKQLEKKCSTNNPFKICEKLDIIVMLTDLPESIKSFYSNFLDSKIIYLNKNLDKKDLYIACAHELGHAVLHEHSNTMFSTKTTNQEFETQDKEANYFCIQLIKNQIVEELAFDNLDSDAINSITLKNKVLKIDMKDFENKRTS